MRISLKLYCKKTKQTNKKNYIVSPKEGFGHTSSRGSINPHRFLENIPFKGQLQEKQWAEGMRKCFPGGHELECVVSIRFGKTWDNHGMIMSRKPANHYVAHLKPIKKSKKMSRQLDITIACGCLMAC